MKHYSITLVGLLFLAFKFYSKDIEKTDKSTDKTFPDTSISTNLDFGNSIGAGLRLAYYF